jgi:YHS domain-containing protein
MRFRSIAVSLALAGCPKKELAGYVEPPPDGAPITCPVRGSTCTKTPDTEAAVFEMRTFYFCTPEARVEFAANPSRYAHR